MKKVLCIFSLLCMVCTGVWADFTPKTVEGTTQYCYTLKCHGSGHANVEYIGLTETSFYGHSANGTRFVFEPTGTDGQYYLRSVVRNKYINAGSGVTFDAAPTTYWTIAQTGNYFFLYANGDNTKYLNNNENSGVGLRVGNYNGECSQWTATEYSYTLPSVSESAKLYRFKNKNYNTNDYITADGENLRGRNKVTNNTQWFFTIESETVGQVYFASAVDGRTAQDVSRSGQEKLGYNKATTFVFDEYTIDDATYYGIRKSDRVATDQSSSLHRDASSNIVGWASKDNATTVTAASMWKMEEIGSDELGSYLTAQKAISHALEASEQGPAEEFALRFKISTSSQKYYYTLKDTKGRNRYAYYNGDDQLLGTDGSANYDNRIFYFTQSDTQKALSNSSYMVVSIHNIVAEGKEMTAKNAWGTTETNWYIKISPNISEPNYIAICPNSNFDNNSWNDYSTTVDNYGANDPNSAWEFVQVSSVKNFTVQVSGLPTSTDMAGVTVCGKNYNNGATVTSAYVDNMAAMEVPGYTALVTGYNTNLRVAYTEKIKASAAPENGEWAANTTWYYIKSKNSNGYISATYTQDKTVDQITYAGLLISNTTKPTDDNGLWALVFDSQNNTYKVYNRNGGVIANCGTADDKVAYIAEQTTAANSNYILEPGVQAGTYCIRINGTTNARWNNRGNYLSTWTSNDSFYGGGNQAGPGGWGAGAVGSQYVFEVYVPEEAASLPNSWNNYSGDNQTEWTQGTSDIVTANTANKTSHYYHDWDFQTATHSGSVTLRFQYGPTPNGSARLDISCVELLNADGTQVLSSDVHNGYTGGQQSNRDYTIKVPAKNTAYKLRVWSFDTRNSHGTITYMNWGDVTASEFEVATAKEIMSDGVGYPKAATTAYTNMAALTEGTSTRDDVADAKSAYVLCTDINMPEDGKAYKLKLVTPAGSSRYITYSAGSALAFTETANDNSVYLCKVVGDKYIFITKDGNILTWMGGADGYLNGGSRKGYSNMYPAIQNDKEDWNLFTCRKQNNAADQFGLVRLAARRKATDLSSLVCQFSNWSWSNANESPFWENTSNRKFSTGILMEEVLGITAETAGYADGVEKYNLYNTAVENNTTYASHFGTGLGKYHYGDNQTTGYMDAVKACTTLEQERAVVPVSINMPEAGKFYRFKGLGHSLRDSKTFYMSAGNAGEELHYTEDTDNKTIFYLTSDNNLLSYSTGLYGNGTILAQVETKGTYTIDATPANNTVEGSVKGIGTYRIYHGSGYLVDWANGGNLQNCADGNNGWAAWVIEEVTELPVSLSTIGDHCYGTLYTPVALDLSEGGGLVKAYAVVVNGDKATMERVGDVIPANSAVVLYSKLSGMNTANLSVGGEANYTGDNALEGQVQTKSVEASTVLTMQNGSTGIGFYNYKGTNLKGFKAYLPKENAQGVQSFTFNFDDIVTGIQQLEDAKQTVQTFDLSGRQVGQTQRGLYIVNGRKVVR